MLNSEFAAAFVAFMNSGLTAAQIQEIEKLHVNEKSHWDISFTKKNSHDNEGREIEGKFFLSSDSRLVYKNPKNPILLRVEGNIQATTQIEIPTVICRNLQNPETLQKRAESASVGRVLTQMAKLDPEKATPEQIAKAKELLARLG